MCGLASLLGKVKVNIVIYFKVTLYLETTVSISLYPTIPWLHVLFLLSHY